MTKTYDSASLKCRGAHFFMAHGIASAFSCCHDVQNPSEELAKPCSGKSTDGKPAIDAFVQCFDNHFEVIHNDYQLILRRIKK